MEEPTPPSLSHPATAVIGKGASPCHLNQAQAPRLCEPGLPVAALLQVDLCALALGGEAGDGPHLDLDARMKLLVPHVPDALDRGGDRFVLQMARCAE